MAATSWKKIRVTVDLTVRDDSFTEKDFRWSIEKTLHSQRTFDEVIKIYRNRGTIARNLTVQVSRSLRDD